MKQISRSKRDKGPYPSMRAALAVRDLPGLLSSGSYQLLKSNLSLGIGTEQFLPFTRTFQKLSSPSPVFGEKIHIKHFKFYVTIVKDFSLFLMYCLGNGTVFASVYHHLCLFKNLLD